LVACGRARKEKDELTSGVKGAEQPFTSAVTQESMLHAHGVKMREKPKPPVNPHLNRVSR